MQDVGQAAAGEIQQNVQRKQQQHQPICVCLCVCVPAGNRRCAQISVYVKLIRRVKEYKICA